VLPHQCEKKRFFLQPASRQLQLAEEWPTAGVSRRLNGEPRTVSQRRKTTQCACSALPGLKSGARRTKINSFALETLRLVLHAKPV